MFRRALGSSDLAISRSRSKNERPASRPRTRISSSPQPVAAAGEQHQRIEQVGMNCLSGGRDHEPTTRATFGIELVRTSRAWLTGARP